jgi:hypothetical protein
MYHTKVFNHSLTTPNKFMKLRHLNFRFISIYQQITFIIIIMDIQEDFFRWQVPDLKEYLQHRSITCHLYRKHELVKLCELQTGSLDACCLVPPI